MAKLTKSKAAEMLKNPPHGKPLTKKQKKYFGMIAHSQDGSSINVQDMIQMEKLRLALFNERKKKRDSFRFDLEHKSPKVNINQAMLEYYKTEPKEYSLIDEDIVVLPKERKEALLKEKKKGGVIKDNMGQYNHPGKITQIDSNRITMKGIPYPVMGVDNLGNQQLMQPEGEYLFPGKKVTEYPLIGKSMKKSKKAQNGATLDEFGRNTSLNWTINPTEINPYIKENAELLKKYGAGDRFIINKEDIERFQSGDLPSDHRLMNLLSGERREILNIFRNNKNLSSIEAGHTDLRKLPKTVVGGKPYGTLGNSDVFRIFSSGFSNESEVTPVVQQDGDLQPILPETKKSVTTKTPPPTKAQYYNVDGKVKVKETAIDPKLVSMGYIPTGKYGKKMKAQFGMSMEDLVPGSTPIQLENTQPETTQWNTSGGGYTQFGMTPPMNNQPIESQGVIESIGESLPIVGNLFQGFGMMKQQKQQRQQAKQARALSKLTRKVSELEPEQVNRKYTRPEDILLDVDSVGSTYGEGTNFLAKNGNTIKAQFGNFIQNQQVGSQFGQPFEGLGSWIGGGQGQASGESMIGSTLGSVAGSFFGPLGGKIGGALGGAIGGIIGGSGARQLRKDQRATQKNLQKAALNQGIRSTQGQYSSFMENGGNLSMNGQLKTYWGGYAEPVSENPYLPEGGESVLFKGNSHKNGGIGMTFGNKPVEVEGGEPAVKLEDGGSLTIFGDMKIPSYGVSELNDPSAKGKKFKSYINNLNKVEAKQNKTIDKAVALTEDNPMNTPFDKLKLSSAEAMITGANMKLKDIAFKKQTASTIQNAILDTADELGLDSSKLAQGKIKKVKKSNVAQLGKKVPYGVGTEVGALAADYINQNMQVSEESPVVEEIQRNKQKYDWEGDLTALTNLVLPYIRPSNQSGLDPTQLSGEMLALATNQLEPVQAQLYSPLLQTDASDISLQDQLNANQADFNAIQRQTGYNPAAQAALAAQKYAANSNVLGEQFRLNQAQKQATYNKNRDILNDATLKNLAILDQQYIRQSQAKSNTKATAQAALNSISDKIAKNKLENRTLGVYENLYNYRYDNKGRAWNLNPLADFNVQGEDLPIIDDSEVTEDVYRDKYGVISKSRTRTKTKNKKSSNGSLLKYAKGY